MLDWLEPKQSTTSMKRSATPSAGAKKKPRLSSGTSKKTSYDRQQAQKWTDEWKPRMLSSTNGGLGRCVECAGKYPELECCKVKGGHFWKVYEFDGWQKSKNPSMPVASDAKSYCPDCYTKEVGRAMRVAKGKHRQAPQSKPQARQRVKDLRKLADDAGLMVEDVNGDDLGDHGSECDEGGDTMADDGIDPAGVIYMPPLHVTAVPMRSPSSHIVTTEAPSSHIVTTDRFRSPPFQTGKPTTSLPI